MKFLQRIRKFLDDIALSKYAAPVALVAAAVLAFGLLIPALGFYWDDWPLVFLGKSNGNFWQYYQSDRPLQALPDLAYLFIAGENPLAWQILSLLTRIATIFTFWWFLSLLWPKAKPQVFSAALLFSIYPVFIQQSMAITYKTHFLCLGLSLASLALMLLAIQKPRYQVPFTLLAVLTGAVQLMTLEYFWGLELLRPVLLWIVIAPDKETRKQALKKAFSRWLPYLLLFCGVVTWRFFIFQTVDDRNAPTLLNALFQTPIASAVKLFMVMRGDSLSMLLSKWLEVFQVQTLDTGSPMMLLSWGLSWATMLAFWFYLSRSYRKGEKDTQASPSWPRQALLVGIFALLAGMIPVWMTSRQASVGMYSDRLAIPAMVGASIFVTGVLFTFLSKRSHRALVIASLVGLSIGFHFRIANDYRWDWTAQERFFWQLYWRAPAIEPDTSFLSKGGLFKYVTKYSLATAINSLYPLPGTGTKVPYWTFELDDTHVTELDPGADLYASLRTLTFSAPVENSLVILYDRTDNSCLWIVSKNDAYYQDMPSSVLDALYLSDLDRILPTPSDNTYPDEDIFGAEPEHTWCYYFEKADLARQLEDWETVSRLGDEAVAKGHSPNNLYEWIPFIEGYLHTGNLEKAQSRTLDIITQFPENGAALCAVWSRSAEAAALFPTGSEILASVQDTLDCPSP